MSAYKDGRRQNWSPVDIDGNRWYSRRAIPADFALIYNTCKAAFIRDHIVFVDDLAVGKKLDKGLALR